MPLVAALTAVTLTFAPASTSLPKEPAQVQKHKAKVRYEWVCKGNSYMRLKKGFKPQAHGCKKVRVAD